MTKLNPYLNFQGNTEEVFHFYRSVFGGEFTSLMRYRDMPGSEKMPETDSNKLMHVSLPIGENIIMGTDILDSRNQTLAMGDNFFISIAFDDEAETKRAFEGLSQGGTVIMSLNAESWSELFGMLKDKYGVQWMFNYNKADR